MKLVYQDEYNIIVTDINNELEKCHELYKGTLENSLEPDYIRDMIVRNIIMFVVDYAMKCEVKYNPVLPIVSLIIKEDDINAKGYIHNGNLMINLTRVEVESQDMTEKKYRYVYGKVDK